MNPESTNNIDMPESIRIPVGAEGTYAVVPLPFSEAELEELPKIWESVEAGKAQSKEYYDRLQVKAYLKGLDTTPTTEAVVRDITLDRMAPQIVQTIESAQPKKRLVGLLGRIGLFGNL